MFLCQVWAITTADPKLGYNDMIYLLPNGFLVQFAT